MRGFLQKDIELLKQNRSFLGLVIVMVIFFVCIRNDAFVIIYLGMMGGFLSISTISYDEADQLVVKSINDTLSEIFPLTRGGSFVGSSSEEVNGTRFTTGYIQYTETVANTNGKIKIKISVPALMIETSVGRYLSDVSTDQARIYEASSGTYTIAQHTTQLTVNFKDKFTVVMSGAGNVEITYGNAVEIGIDMEFFGYSENTSYNTYTRIPFVIGTTYKVPNR